MPHLVVRDRYQWVPYTATKPNDFIAIGLLKPLNSFFIVSRSQMRPAGDV